MIEYKIMGGAEKHHNNHIGNIKSLYADKPNSAEDLARSYCDRRGFYFRELLRV